MCIDDLIYVYVRVHIPLMPFDASRREFVYRRPAVHCQFCKYKYVIEIQTCYIKQLNLIQI